MSAPVQVVCPHCQAINRVPAQRLGERPNCGRCHQPLFGGTPVALDAAAFERHAAHDGIPLLVDFWAAWCGPCRAMAPEFERAAGLLEPQVRLAKVDTEAVPELAQRFAIRSIPTLVLFRAGREVARQPGATNADTIVRWVRSVS